MEITLTPDIERALLEQAQQRGITPEELALESLRRQFVMPSQAQEPGEAQGTLADLLGDSIGALRSHEHVPGGAHISEATGETFAKALLDKRNQSRL